VPVFDRSLELSRSSAYIIPKETKIVLVEGNYLLLDSYPWSELHQYYHYTILLDCDEKTLEQRLIERWKGFKLDKDQINKKVYENDLPNGIKVIQNSIQPTFKLKN
jgi:pantothenate kinase